MAVEIRELPQMHVAYIRHTGPYGPQISSAFQKLMKWAERRKILDENAHVLAVYWDNPDTTPPDDCRSDACVTLSKGTVKTDEDIHFQTLRAGTFAVYRCEIRDGDFEKPWNYLVRTWLPASSYRPGPNPCYEIYHNDTSQDPDAAWVLTICLSIEPA